jgi:glycosyltransferase involved in cell wall biosynthesis
MHALEHYQHGSAELSGFSNEARACVEDNYAWEQISPTLGALFGSAKRKKENLDSCIFSVVVPSYDRHLELDEIMKCLQAQEYRSFEVIVVDQTPTPWGGRNTDFGFPLTYFHSLVKGAALSRNTGAFLAQGKVLVFTDDDCRPSPSWLASAIPYFLADDVVAIEGLIESDHLDDPDFRPVTNVGFEGIGFMTANLFVRSCSFQLLGGFDLAFDRPHFREDTDLGWRLLGLGSVPYAKDVKVYHPAQPRNKARESLQERSKCFKNDALLYKKHPTKYKDLFFMECQYMHNPYYAEYLLAGFSENGMAPPDWLISTIEIEKNRLSSDVVNSSLGPRKYSSDFAFVNKSYQKDLSWSVALYVSWERFASPKRPYYLIVPEADINTFRDAFLHCIGSDQIRQLPIILSEELIFRITNTSIPQSFGGWHTQQVVKMVFSKTGFAQQYLTIDSASVFAKPFDYRSLYSSDGKLLTPARPYRKGVLYKEFLDNNENGSLRGVTVNLSESFEEICTIMGNLSDYTNFYISGTGMFDSDTLIGLEGFAHNKGYDGFAGLIEVAPYEMFWYGEYVYSKHADAFQRIEPSLFTPCFNEREMDLFVSGNLPVASNQYGYIFQPPCSDSLNPSEIFDLLSSSLRPSG